MCYSYGADNKQQIHSKSQNHCSNNTKHDQHLYLVHQSGVEYTEFLAAISRLISAAHQVVNDLTDVKQRVPVTHGQVL